MPIKFKESVKRRDGSIENYYIKGTSLKELRAALENSNTKPKVKQKVRNELVRRGESFISTDLEKESNA